MPVDDKARNETDRNQQHLLPTCQDHAGKLEPSGQQPDRELTPFLVFSTVLHLVQPHQQVGEEDRGRTQGVSKGVGLFREEQGEEEDRL